MIKNRQKKNSILNFVAVAILALIGIVLSVCSFKIPFTNTTYNGFINSIPLGLDLAGGVSVVYDCSVSEDSQIRDLDKAIDNSLDKLAGIVKEEYPEAVVVRQGDSKIRIEAPGATEGTNIFDLIGNPAPLNMTIEENGEAIITGSDIEDVYVSFSGESYGVVIDFTDEGSEKFADMTAQASDTENGGSGNIYIYLGDTSGDAFNTLTCEEEITTGNTFISGSNSDGSAWTYDDAQNYAVQILSGTFNITLDIAERTEISASLGQNALMFCLIAGAVAIVLAMVFMWLRYGDFGFLAAFALIIHLVLMVFLLQAVTFVRLSLSGLAGVMLSLVVVIGGMIAIFEKIREEYRSGKKIPLAYKSGFKRSFWSIFDSHIALLIAAIVFCIAGSAGLQSFGISLVIGVVLSMFTNLVVLRFFVKWYLPFNSVKAKSLHLPKQVKPVKESEVVEIITGGDAV